MENNTKSEICAKISYLQQNYNRLKDVYNGACNTKKQENHYLVIHLPECFEISKSYQNYIDCIAYLQREFDLKKAKLNRKTLPSLFKSFKKEIKDLQREYALLNK